MTMNKRNDDADAEAQAQQAREQGTQVIRQHLRGHLDQNPTSSYVTWIATLHPENATVSIDPRFLTPGNPWVTVYEETKYEIYARNVVQEPTSSTTEDEKTWRTPLDLIIGVSFAVSGAALTFGLELTVCILRFISTFCEKAAKSCYPPNLFSALPLLVTGLLYICLRPVEYLLLWISVLVVEMLAVISGILCGFFACSGQVGKASHQRTRRLSHLTRWACRRSLGTPPQEMEQSDLFATEVDPSQVTPTFASQVNASQVTPTAPTEATPPPVVAHATVVAVEDMEQQRVK